MWYVFVHLIVSQTTIRSIILYFDYWNNVSILCKYIIYNAKSSIAQTDIPPGALITFLQKGLEYIGIEENINEV